MFLYENESYSFITAEWLILKFSSQPLIEPSCPLVYCIFSKAFKSIWLRIIGAKFEKHLLRHSISKWCLEYLFLWRVSWQWDDWVRSLRFTKYLIIKKSKDGHKQELTQISVTFVRSIDYFVHFWMLCYYHFAKFCIWQ